MPPPRRNGPATAITAGIKIWKLGASSPHVSTCHPMSPLVTNIGTRTVGKKRRRRFAPSTYCAVPARLEGCILFWMVASPVAISSCHGFGSGSDNFPSPIWSGIHRYRESHCVHGFQMSPMKITVVVFEPVTLSINVDCDP